MAVKVIASWQVLMDYAHALGRAKKARPIDREAIRIAQNEHDDYKKVCLDADAMSVPQLSSYMRVYGATCKRRC